MRAPKVRFWPVKLVGICEATGMKILIEERWDDKERVFEWLWSVTKKHDPSVFSPGTLARGSCKTQKRARAAARRCLAKHA